MWMKPGVDQTVFVERIKTSDYICFERAPLTLDLKDSQHTAPCLHDSTAELSWFLWSGSEIQTNDGFVIAFLEVSPVSLVGLESSYGHVDESYNMVGQLVNDKSLAGYHLIIEETQEKHTILCC